MSYKYDPDTFQEFMESMTMKGTMSDEYLIGEIIKRLDEQRSVYSYELFIRALVEFETGHKMSEAQFHQWMASEEQYLLSDYFYGFRPLQQDATPKKKKGILKKLGLVKEYDRKNKYR